MNMATNTANDFFKATKTHHLDISVDEYNLFTVTFSTNQPLIVSLTLNGTNLIMEIDMAKSIMRFI